MKNDSNNDNNKDSEHMIHETYGEPDTSITDNFYAKLPHFGKELWKELTYFRNLPIKKKSKRSKDLNIPVAIFTKEDRLKNEIGIELNIIFKSKACSWARSHSGGCTMCGYWNDRAPESLTDDNLWNQFEYALEDKSELLNDQDKKIIFKMFSSGSFCDPKEFPKELQYRILEKIKEYKSIKEIVIESRPEYITDDILENYRRILHVEEEHENERKEKKFQYLEIGIGLETSNDFIRKNFINKGFSWDAFRKAVEKIHHFGFGVKAYLLFKPPFMEEYSAIRDIKTSIRDCININVDTISINPANIQNNTICSILENQRLFRPPWFYSLLHIIKSTLTPDDLTTTRIISDPSASGKSRGIHNCEQGNESNYNCQKILEEFVLKQNLDLIPKDFKNESCWNEFIYEVLL